MLAMYISANQFKVSSDLTTDFTAGRRIKADCGSDGVKYSTIVSSSYSSQYTTVTIDEEVLTANLIDILYGIINVGPEGSFPEHVHDDTEGQGGQISLSDLTNKSFLSLTDRSFLNLTDTPSSYDEGKYLRSTVDGTEWVTVSGSSAATTILELTDTPSSYDEGKYLRSTASGIEFVDVSQYTEATIIADSDLFVLSSAGTDKKLTGATFKAISGTYREVLVSTSGINLTADQCRSSILNNDGQQTENIAYLPDCEEGLSSTVEITSVSGSFHLKPKSSDKIFLDGEELDNGDKVSITSPVSGNSFSFYAVKKGSVYSWKVVSGPNTTVIDGGT